MNDRPWPLSQPHQIGCHSVSLTVPPASPIPINGDQGWPSYASTWSRATVGFSCSQSNSSDNSAGLSLGEVLGGWMGDTLATCIIFGAGEMGDAGVIVEAQGSLWKSLLGQEGQTLHSLITEYHPAWKGVSIPE